MWRVDSRFHLGVITIYDLRQDLDYLIIIIATTTIGVTIPVVTTVIVDNCKELTNGSDS